MINMFKAQNRIILVDDVPSHLDRLAKVFISRGLGCLPLEYDSFFNSPFRNVRLAFFDINLRTNNFDVNQAVYNYEADEALRTIFNDLADAIKSYIAVDNGPYALIFWSSNVGLIENFKRYVIERGHQIPKPILIDGIDKNIFLELVGDQENVTVDLPGRIEEILSNSPISLLFDFEERVQSAASESINEIYSLIPSNDPWGTTTDFDRNFELIFSKIASQVAGIKHARKLPDVAVFEALAPTILYKIVNNSNNHAWKDYLSSLANSSISYPEGFRVGRLNSIFHLDLDHRNDMTRRGAVYQYYPVNYDVPMNEYYASIENHSKALFNKFFQYKDDVTNSSQREVLRGKAKFILVEISASCDYSQDKDRNHKFLFGMLSPAVERSLLKLSLVPESVLYKDLPVVSFDGEDWNLWLNLNHTFSGFEPFEGQVFPLFVLKKEIIDMIGNRYANHVSRIGITTF